MAPSRGGQRGSSWSPLAEPSVARPRRQSPVLPSLEHPFGGSQPASESTSPTEAAQLMARSSRGAATATRAKPRSGRRAEPRPVRRRPPVRKAALRSPLLTPDQRRELGGVGAVGVGLVLATVLAVPGGGTVARPVHDGLLALLGTGAWLAAAGLVVAGVRVLAQRTWTSGLLGAGGSLVTTTAVLGLLGLAASGSAGWMGQRIGPGLAHRLGTAGAGSALVVAAALGLVLAVELRMGRLAAAARSSWERRDRSRSSEDQQPAAAMVKTAPLSS